MKEKRRTDLNRETREIREVKKNRKDKGPASLEVEIQQSCVTRPAAVIRHWSLGRKENNKRTRPRSKDRRLPLGTVCRAPTRRG